MQGMQKDNNVGWLQQEARVGIVNKMGQMGLKWNWSGPIVNKMDRMGLKWNWSGSIVNRMGRALKEKALKQVDGYTALPSWKHLPVRPLKLNNLGRSYWCIQPAAANRR